MTATITAETLARLAKARVIGASLVRAAKKRRRLADLVNAMDREYGGLLNSRYGWDGEELDGDLVEVIDYGNDMHQRITLAWIDERMARIGFKPVDSLCPPNRKE